MAIEFTVGTNTLLELTSLLHGTVRVPLAQNFDYTPSFDERRIFEFDTSDAVAIVTNFNGVDIAFTHFDSNNQLVDAMVNDLDPGAVALVDDPSRFKDITITLNIRRKSDNKIFQSVLAKGVRITGAAAAEPVREEGVIARTGVATNVFRLKGVALEYNRVLRSGSSAFVQGSSNSQSDKTTVTSGSDETFDVDNNPQVVEANDPAINGKSIIHVLKNGDEYTGAISIVGTTVSIPTTEFATDDVFEVWTSYID